MTNIEPKLDQPHHLEAAKMITLRLGKILDLPVLARELVKTITELTHYRRALLMVADDTDTFLQFGALSSPLPSPDAMRNLETGSLGIYHVENDPVVSTWLRNYPLILTADSERTAATWLLRTLNTQRCFSLPLMVDQRLAGVLILDELTADAQIETDYHLLENIAPNIAIALDNARQHTKTVQELANKMRELYIMRQIDRELNETIVLDHVFNMTLDWALRYTSGQAASIALYDEATDDLRFVVDLGYDLSPQQIAMVRAHQGGGIIHRVARSGQSEMIPDVSMDKDYVRLASLMQSQLCAPVTREDRVIAVVSIESKRINAFHEEHLDFVEKLATRAGVAIDNARLYTEAVREREKLSQILSNIADVVIVVSPDGKILLINQAALAAMRLYTNQTYAGRLFTDVFDDTDLLKIYRRATAAQGAIVDEVQLPNGRTFYANLAVYEGIGWIIVLHDITPLKETDRLKSELVATVSHDLKQPLSVMYGYSELLLMQQKLDPQMTNFVNMIQRAITNMRTLIDDLLDLAKIESGVQLDTKPIHIKRILATTLENIKHMADLKGTHIKTSVPDNLPPVMGDQGYLGQIFTNLVGNAVKYTPPEGRVHISAEHAGHFLRIAIQDNGMGISPEDQARIFDRFYRVRRPETDSIEGTGLGLAIVKRLVEMHNGQISLKSRLGEGTTFYVTLPTYPDYADQISAD